MSVFVRLRNLPRNLAPSNTFHFMTLRQEIPSLCTESVFLAGATRSWSYHGSYGGHSKLGTYILQGGNLAKMYLSLLIPSTQTLDNNFYIVDTVDTFSCVGARARGQRIDNLKKVIENTFCFIFSLQTDHPRELQHGPVRLSDGPTEMPTNHRKL